MQTKRANTGPLENEGLNLLINSGAVNLSVNGNRYSREQMKTLGGVVLGASYVIAILYESCGLFLC